MLTPQKYDRGLQLRTLLGVDDAKQVRDEIMGRFKDVLIEFGGKREGRLIDKFLNWPDDAPSVVRFTRQYGPLEISATPSSPFRFHTADFRSAQDRLGGMWRNLGTHPEQEIQGGSLRFRQGTITYTATTLFMYLYVDLATIPVERVKICKRNQCVHPFFIAGHLKQRFCSDECAEEGQRELKKEWWDKNGSAWRASRRTKSK